MGQCTERAISIYIDSFSLEGRLSKLYLGKIERKESFNLYRVLVNFHWGKVLKRQISLEYERDNLLI